ncbi:MAG: hypothetical protein KKB36_13055 [Gammaproteobacteria bacterium]|uniref:Uncharacterized protein n=1 Tax=viral metagenome TaxID=1070528 RepID=A0A6M3M2M2_9ZZZZ|nr:hypothetical protein [Gammaproteobacteria bacterium]MBU0883282.1 hypothetical protein [Gammaproteobacteria bacterium]
MDTAQHATPRCPVYLHPACASKPDTVLSIQQATRQLVVISGGRPTLKPVTTHTDNFGPFGGDAA